METQLPFRGPRAPLVLADTAKVALDQFDGPVENLMLGRRNWSELAWTAFCGTGLPRLAGCQHCSGRTAGNFQDEEFDQPGLNVLLIFQ